MRIPFIMILVAAMLAACGSLGTTRATDSSGTTVQATSVSQTDDAASDKKLKGGVNKRVLVVDNSQTQLNYMSEQLTKRGYVVSTAVDASTTMQLLEANADALPDIILIEVVLPGMNGFQLTRAITRDSRYVQIPIFIVTSKGQETDRIWGLRQGARDYLVKPVDMDELIVKMKSVW